MPSPVRLAVVAAVVLFATRVTADEPQQNVKSVVFETDVLPLLKAKCIGCHNPKTRKADLDLTTAASIARGGESGELVTPGKLDESLLYDMVHEGLMPPEGKPPLTAAEQHRLADWIRGGARTKAGAFPSPESLAEVSQHDALPILRLRCTVCHGLRKQDGGLDLTSRASILEGGKHGPAMIVGDPAGSPLLKRIHAGEMPPREQLVRAGVRPLEPSEIETLTAWIAAGAPEIDLAPDVATNEPDPLVTDEDRDFWSFKPPVRAKPPMVQDTSSAANPIDRFVLARLESNGLGFSPEADRYTLIRRVAFDLTGLPPEWADVERFAGDRSPDWYVRMVDFYLDDPAYGERWGQYWLDLAGYADSEGKRSADPLRPHAWRYRDYVVRAFANDKPYDRFLLEQIAGDELVDYENAPVITREIEDNLVATGFLRMAPDGTGSDIVNTVAERLEVVADEVNVLGSSVLGLTVKCAQCHSHKYDPIPQRDYYRLIAVFKGAFDEHDWLKPSIVPGQSKNAKPGRVLTYVSDAERAAWNEDKKRIETRIGELQSAIDTERSRLHAETIAKGLVELPEEIRKDVRKAVDTPAGKRSEVQKYLAGKFEKRLKPADGDLRKRFGPFDRLLKNNGDLVKQLQGELKREPAIRALWDRGVPSPTYVYRRGEFTNRGTHVGPGVPSVLTDGTEAFHVERPWPGARQTGRRLAFAKWLTQPDHPLTARVMVNRLWKHHFGEGLVRSLGNFGKTGTLPTHPELLDWLATEFVRRGWSMKAMHRLMLTSRTYRQQSGVTDELDRLDPENRWLSRMPLRRLEAEAVRDGVAAVAARLDQRRFGRPDAVDVRPDGLVTTKPTESGYRRSIYVLHRRKEMPTILENFDLPQMIPNCVERPSSTVASQALHLLNNTLIRSLGSDFADRVIAEVGRDPERQVQHVYRIALGREPTSEERVTTVTALAELRSTWNAELKDAAPEEAERRALGNLCHTIVNSAAFLYVD